MRYSFALIKLIVVIALVASAIKADSAYVLVNRSMIDDASLWQEGRKKAPATSARIIA